LCSLRSLLARRYNARTGESSWERPDEFEEEDGGEEKKDGGMSGLEDYLGEVATNVDTPMTEEPKGGGAVGAKAWETHLDAESKRVYYYNKVTDETTWDKPAELGPTPKKGLGGEFAGEASVGGAAGSGVVELEDGWQQFTDKSSGRKYFFNPETKESRWDSMDAPAETSGGGGGGGGGGMVRRMSFEGRRGSVGANPVLTLSPVKSPQPGAGGDDEHSLYSSDSSYSLGMNDYGAKFGGTG
jgi:hypothetical protein